MRENLAPSMTQRCDQEHYKTLDPYLLGATVSSAGPHPILLKRL